VQFHVYSFRFEFSAIDAVHFPAGKPGNILRGALGMLLQQDDRAYARVFRPASAAGSPSGLSDPPRLFVFRAAHLDGVTAQPGERFHFGLNIFETRRPVVDHFTRAFAQLAGEGLGPGRGRAELIAVHALNDAGRPLALELDARPEPIRRLRVRFVTPTELKLETKLTARPEFPALFNRARDRISTLRALYQDGPLPIDFHDIGRRAAAVRLTRCELEWHDTQRHSSRTGQVHPIGGFTGEAEYEGNLAEFHPYLHAAQWTGIGRHTVWGNGAIKVTVME